MWPLLCLSRLISLASIAWATEWRGLYLGRSTHFGGYLTCFLSIHESSSDGEKGVRLMFGSNLIFMALLLQASLISLTLPPFCLPGISLAASRVASLG